MLDFGMDRWAVSLAQLKERMAHLKCVRCKVEYHLHEFEDHYFIEDQADIAVEERN
jgi:hypothetical protein